MTEEALPLPVSDLHDRLGLGLARGRGLLGDDERGLVERALGLQGEAALLLARLCGRRSRVFRVPDLVAAGVDDLRGALGELVAGGLAGFDVPWAERAEAATRPVLLAGCARLGLPRAGRREDLVERLRGREGWDDAPWVSLVAADVLLRVERMGTLQVQPDRSSPVLARMGRLRWPDYATTGLGALLPDRGAWDRWESLVDREDDLPVAEALEALGWSAWPPGGLDRRDALGHALRDHARGLERAGDLDAAAQLWGRLDALGQGGRDHVVRRARCVERQGRVEEALGVLEEGREGVDAPARLAIARAGRRVASSLGRAWVPDPPLRTPTRRTLRLDRVEQPGPRPRYDSGGVGRLVEDAVVALLAAHGRRAVHGEARTWSTLVTLLVADALFLPVPGQLPTPFLAGPLDLGTPGFAARRPAAVQAALDAVRQGEGPARVAAAWDALHGTLIHGVDWGLASRDELVALSEGAGPEGVRAVLVRWLRWGWRALGGLPDLVVLPGEAVRVDGLHPSTVGPQVHVVEVKGEHDSLRDGQRVWLDRLEEAGVSAEVWWVVAGPQGPATARGPS